MNWHVLPVLVYAYVVIVLSSFIFLVFSLPYSLLEKKKKKKESWLSIITCSDQGLPESLNNPVSDKHAQYNLNSQVFLWSGIRETKENGTHILFIPQQQLKNEGVYVPLPNRLCIFPWPCNNIAYKQTLTSTSLNRYHSLALLCYAFDLEKTNRLCSNIYKSLFSTRYFCCCVFFLLFSLFTASHCWDNVWTTPQTGDGCQERCCWCCVHHLSILDFTPVHNKCVCVFCSTCFFVFLKQPH